MAPQEKMLSLYKPGEWDIEHGNIAKGGPVLYCVYVPQGIFQILGSRGLENGRLNIKCCDGKTWMDPLGNVCKYPGSSTLENEFVNMKML